MSFPPRQPPYLIAPSTDLHPIDQGRYRLHLFNCGHKVLLPVRHPCALNCIKPLYYPAPLGYYFNIHAACTPQFSDPYLRQLLPVGFISPRPDTHWSCAVCEPERRRFAEQEAAKVREAEEAKAKEAKKKAEEAMLRYQKIQAKVAEEAAKKAEEEAKQKAMEESRKTKDVPEARDDWECEICGLGCFCYHLPGDEWIDAPSLPKASAPQTPEPVNQPRRDTNPSVSDTLQSDVAKSIRTSTPSHFGTPIFANAAPVHTMHPLEYATPLQTQTFDPPKGPSNLKWHTNQRYSERKVKEHHHRKSNGGYRG